MAKQETKTQEVSSKVQVKKNRCWKCNKKIALTGIECKCGYIFCTQHSFFNEHDCTFDYRAQAKKELIEANPTITPSKIIIL